MITADDEIISQLWDAIADAPRDVELKVVLMDQYVHRGPDWKETAQEVAKQILELDPNHAAALKVAAQRTNRQPAPRKEDSTKTSSPSQPNVTKVVHTPSAKRISPVHETTQPPKLSEHDIRQLEAHFEAGVRQIQDNGKLLHEDAQALQKAGPDGQIWNEHISKLHALSEGRFNVVITGSPCSVRELAREIQSRKDEAVDIATDDLNDFILWLKQEQNITTFKTIRDRMVKRAKALEAALTGELQWIASTAMMHTEHEVLERKYENRRQETMLGDDIADIPREQFWVTSDNFAWNMIELTQALVTQGGIRVNPLTGQLFSKDDIEGIVKHPLAKGIAEVELEQESLAQGVRSKTIDQMQKLADALLADQSEDSAPSRLALDVFQLYTATLPESERKALEKLRVPAVDSHTGQQFLSSVGDAIADAIANRICAHKTGDLVGQAAEYLKNFSPAPDPVSK